MLFLCVNVYCHRVTTQLQLINIIIIIIIIFQGIKLHQLLIFFNTGNIAIRGLCSSLRKIVPVRVRKEHRDVMVHFHLFSTPALDRGEWSAPLFTTLPLGQTQRYSLNRILGMPHSRFGFPAEGKYQESNPGPFTM